jgi:hypothetical protein
MKRITFNDIMQSMRTLIVTALLLSSLAHAGEVRESAPLVRDEVLSQKYEDQLLAGEDRDFVEDQMTQDGVTAEELELSEELEEIE